MLLTWIIFLPLLGALVLLLTGGKRSGPIRGIALAVTLLDLLLCVRLWFVVAGTTVTTGSRYLLSHEVGLIPEVGFSYAVGADGLATVMVALTAFLSFLCIPASFTYIAKREKSYYILLLLLQTGMLGTFLATDLLLFFMFWELMLVPMYLLIGIWGGAQRIYASLKFFLYTGFGSALMLIALFCVAFHIWDPDWTGPVSFSLDAFMRAGVPENLQLWFFAAFFLAFAIKMPLFPVHTWLPYAHTEAPTAGSVILAGILLKTGVYGYLRFALPIFPQGAAFFAPLMLVLALIGIIYGAFLALIQTDVKRLVAYSSVSHMGTLMVGLYAANHAGVSGGILQMVNHGLSTGALFLVVGIIYERLHTRDIKQFGGLAKVVPVYASFFLLFTLSSIGLPGLNGFVGEFLIFIGLAQRSILALVIASTGVILGAAYMLWLYQRMMFGPIVHEKNRGIPDLDRREVLVLVPILIACIWIGLYPAPMLDMIEPSVEEIVEAMPWSEGETWSDAYPGPHGLSDHHAAIPGRDAAPAGVPHH